MSRMRDAILAAALALAASSALAAPQGAEVDRRARGADARDTGAPTPAPPLEVRTSDGPVTLRLSAPTSRVEAGQPLAMELSIEAADGYSFEVPLLGKSLGPFDVLSSTRQSSQSGSTRRATLTFTVLTLDSGDVAMPAIPVPIVRADGTRATIDAGPATVTVTSLLAGEFDPAALRDIKGPVEIDVGWAWWWLVAACAAGAMVLLAAITLWRQRARRMAPPAPAHEWALAELDALERDALPEAGQTHPFWVRLSDIVRQYVERRFDLRAPERTTPEFLDEARSNASLTEEHRALLAQFLRMADMVKFAGVRPAAEDCGSALDTARVFVRQTVPTDAARGDARTGASGPVAAAAPEGGAR